MMSLPGKKLRSSEPTTYLPSLESNWLPIPVIHTLNRYPKAAIAGLSIVIAAALTFVAWSAFQAVRLPAPPQRVTMAYFYDQNSLALFEAPADLEGPLETPTGLYHGMPAGVRAVVLSCENCNDSTARYIGWLEAPVKSLGTAGKALPARPQYEDGMESRLAIRTPDSEQWHYFNSAQGADLVEKALRRCAGRHPARLCDPPRRLAREIDPALLKAAHESLTSASQN